MCVNRGYECVCGKQGIPFSEAEKLVLASLVSSAWGRTTKKAKLGFDGWPLLGCNHGCDKRIGPGYGYVYAWCGHSKIKRGRKLPQNKYFPEWCPLPDYNQ